MKTELFHEKTVIETIHEYYGQIFSAEKKVADFILANPEKIINFNVSELASKSDVSDATVIRFCKHIGFDGYHHLKICLSRDIGRKQGNGSLDPYGFKPGSIGELLNGIINNIASIGRVIDPNVLATCVNLLRSCGYVHLVAIGNSTSLAQYLGFWFGRIGLHCTFGSPEYFFSQINLARPGDVVLAISQSGSTKQVVQAVDLAAERGLKTIAISKYKHSPLSKRVDHLLLSANGEKFHNLYMKYSLLSEMIVIETLLYHLLDGNYTNLESLDIVLSNSKL